MRPASLAVVGLGAIGGSVAWQARRQGIARVVGYSPERSEAVQALRAGALSDVAHSAERAVDGADLVFLAAPPQATLNLISAIPPLLKRGALVTDVTSVKSPILDRARAAGLAAVFAGSHPFAGSHRSGWGAARADLFQGALVYVCSTGPEGDNASRQIMNFWETVMGAHPVLVDATVHDQRLAWTSHLPQAVASVLAHTLAQAAHLEGASLGTGARDTTRLAASNSELWTELLFLNAKEIGRALEQASDDLSVLRGALAAGDKAAVRAFLERGAAFRRALDDSGEGVDSRSQRST
jgi:prephenate dehydrogenase